MTPVSLGIQTRMGWIVLLPSKTPDEWLKCLRQMCRGGSGLSRAV